MSEFDWNRHLNAFPSPNAQVKFLNDFIINVMGNYVPNENKIYRSRDPDWMTANIKKKLRKQNKLFKNYRRNGYLVEHKKVLDDFKADCTEEIRKAKESYLKTQGNRLADPKLAQKTYWKILNKFLNKCNLPRIPPLFVNSNFIVNCKEKAKIFNNFFAVQCTPFLNASVLPSFTYLTAARIYTISFSLLEIKDILINLDVSKAHGPDGISGKMISICGEHLSIPLEIIFNNIIETGEFPDQWKLANVTPIHKKKDKQIHTNYRPISLLPLLAKIFDKAIFKHLYNYFFSNSLISLNQSGFTPGDSCTNQLISLVNEILKAFDDPNCLEVRSVYLDMSKAFDKVWHDGLIFKLKRNGVNGKLLALLKNYLQNRKQRVVINGAESDWASLSSGVPQGSVLGPLLFLIYINDLEDGIKSKVKFFADDTSLFSIVKDPKLSADELNHDLELISKWAYQWKMCFNPDPDKPAEEIIFSHKQSVVEHPPIFFNGAPVKRVVDHKHLGLVFDSKLNFVKHINEKIKVARKWIGVIKHVSPYVPIPALDQIYKMRVRPHLDYCDVIFHTPIITHDFDSSLTLNYQMKILESTQYQAALAVSGCWRGTNTDKIYEELGWESLDQRRYFRRLVMFYKLANGMVPNYLREPVRFPQRILRSSDIPLIKNRTDRYLHSFYPDSVINWNNIGTEIREAKTISIFKNTLLGIIRPPKKEIFGIHNYGLKWIFQLRVGLSCLRDHKHKHHFIDTPSPLCSCNISDETTIHYLLECSNFNSERNELVSLLNDILFMHDMENLPVHEKANTLLYGHDSLLFDENRMILKGTIKFIRKSGRFSKNDD